MSTFHEQTTTLNWAPFRLAAKQYDSTAYMGLSYGVVSSDEYVRFLSQDGFDFTGRKDCIFMSVHIQAMDALTFGAYQ